MINFSQVFLSVLASVLVFVIQTSRAADHVLLQLRWDHQFQFAGYYAARWQGYYAQADLDVDIRSALTPGGQIRSATTEVAEGRADFGIGSADILIARDKGLPLVVLAVIFQQSAAEFYALKDPQMNSPADLVRLRVARHLNDLIDVGLQAMLRAEGIRLADVPPHPYESGLGQLIRREVDVIPGYRISVPCMAQHMGVRLRVLQPSAYGVDFYGDSLFTTEKQVEENPGLTDRFVSASLKGWEYAPEHPVEVADRITHELPRIAPMTDRGCFNRFRIRGVRQLTLYPLIEIGYVTPLRWQRMQHLLKQSGLVTGELDTDRFIPDLSRQENERFVRLRKILCIGGFCILLVSGLCILWIWLLRKTVSVRTAALQYEIGERMQAEAALKESETRYRSLFRDNHAIMLLIGPDTGHIVDANPAACAFYSYTAEQIKKMTIYDISASALAKHADDICAPAFLKSRRMTCRHRLASGEVRDVEIYSGPIRIDGQTLLNAIVHDVTDKRKVEEALRKSEQLFRGIFDQSFQFMGVLTPDGLLMQINQAAREFFYAPHAAVIGTLFWDTPWWNYSEAQQRQLKDAIQKAAAGNTVRLEATCLNRKGEANLIDVSVKPVKDDSGNVLLLIAEGRDITEIRHTEDDLRLSESRLSALLKLSQMSSASPEEITDFALEQAVRQTRSEVGYLAFMNEDETVLTMYAWSEKAMKQCRIKDCPVIYPVPCTGLWGEAVRQRKPIITNDYAAPDSLKKGLPQGHIPIRRHMNVPIFEGSRIVAVAGVGNKTEPYNDSDVRQLKLLMQGMWRLIQQRRENESRKKLEAQLRQSQKMEAIGTLAGGIAHDFNNILFPIIGYTEMSMDDLPEESIARKNMEEVLIAAHRAQGVVRQILAFSRETETEHRPVEIRSIVREVLRFIRASLPSTIRIRQDICPDTGRIMADPVQIHQVIMNLCTNAYQAMRDKGGVLGIRLINKELTVEDAVTKLHLEPGPYIKLTVCDTGCGMGRSVIDKIFEPYFTTKDRGEGTGLGLSIVHGIVNSHNGHIAVCSEPGQGTRFNLYLPRIDQGDAGTETVSAYAVPGGSERILMVDDEEQIINMQKRLLELLGYDVTAQTRSTEALAVFRENPDAFDLVITDYTMPDITGDRLAQEMISIRPDIPVILLSGFSEILTEQKVRTAGIRKIIMKPVVRRHMADAIREVLGEPRYGP